MKRIAFVTVLLLCASPAYAVTRTVCPSGCDHTTLQAAVNAAAYGDTITMQAGTTFTEQVSFPNKGAGSSFITITSDASAGSLPGDGVRTGPAYAAFMPKLKSTGGAASVTFAVGAHHYYFKHIHFLHNPHGYAEIMQIGDAGAITKARTEQPTDIVIDRSYFQGDSIDGQKRGISINGARIEIKNSYFTNMAAVGQDSQCAGGWNGTGPILFENNYCEAATENFMMGGSDPLSRVRLTVTGGASTTGANVATSEGGHTLSELQVGDFIAIDVAAGSGAVTLEFRTIASITGSGATGSITWTPATSTTPDTTASSIRHDTVANDITVRYNLFTKNIAWRDGILAKPTNPAAVAGGGGTLSGTFYYRWVAYATGQQELTINSPASDEVSATASGGNGTITTSCTAVAGAETYRLYRGTASNTQNQFIVDADCNLADNGSLSWTGGSVPAPTKWVVKNLFEIKAATSVQVYGNIFENLWEDSNVGGRLAWWLKAENQNDNGGCWTCRAYDLTLERNIVRKSYGWFQANGRYAVNGSPLVRPDFMRNLTVRNNLVYDCNSSEPPGWGQGPGSLGWTVTAAQTINMTVDHNTVVCLGMNSPLSLGQDVDPYHENFVWTNNMTVRGEYGVRCYGEGTVAFTDCANPGYTFAKNTIATANCGIYPADNFCPTQNDWEASYVNFVANGVGANFLIVGGSPYKNAGTDGKDLGADIALVLESTALAETGIPTSSPPRLRISVVP